MIDINLVTWNGEEWLSLCLDSLDKQTCADWRLNIIDNGSKDDSAKIIEAWLAGHPERKGLFIRHQENIGFSPAHNELLRSSHAPLVLVLNQDTILTSSYLEKLSSAFEEEPALGSASGLLLRLEGNATSPVFTQTVDAAGLAIYRMHRVVDRLQGRPQAEAGPEPTQVFGVPAAVAMYRRSALESVAINRHGEPQYFDSDFFAYKEDVDLAYRLQVAGWGSMVVSAVIAYHERGLKGINDGAAGGTSTMRHRRSKSSYSNYLSYRNHLLFLRGSFAFPLFSSTWWSTFFYETLKFFVLLLTEPSTLRAFGDIQKLSDHSRAKRQEIRSRPYHPHAIARFF